MNVSLTGLGMETTSQIDKAMLAMEGFARLNTETLADAVLLGAMTANGGTMDEDEVSELIDELVAAQTTVILWQMVFRGLLIPERVNGETQFSKNPDAE